MSGMRVRTARNADIAPEQQGAGVGTALLHRAELIAIEHRVDAVRLYMIAAMAEALAYSPPRGYLETGRGTEHAHDRVRLEKRLG
jgi:GNAT superfamily N-acetyltransferase